MDTQQATQLISTLCNTGTTRSIAIQTEAPAENKDRSASAISATDVQAASDHIVVPVTHGANGGAPLHALESPPTTQKFLSAAGYFTPPVADDDFTPPQSSLKKQRARRANEPSSSPSKFKMSPARKGILRSSHTPYSDKSVHFSPKDYSTLFRKDQVLDMELFEKRKKLGLDLGPDPSIRPIGRTKARIKRGGWAEGRRLQRKAEEEGELDEEAGSEMTGEETEEEGAVNLEDGENQEEGARTEEEKIWAAQVSFIILGLEEKIEKS